MDRPFISVVSPVYGCKNCLAELYQRLAKVLGNINPLFEIIFVNDSSPDNAWDIILELAEKDQRVKGVNLSRNFGQHYAIIAGIAHSKGKWITVMDCDLQDKPEEIVKLFDKTREGYDIVLARRVLRQDNYLKRLGSKWFYKLLAYLTDTEQNAEVANFGIYHRKVINAVLNMNDQIKYFPAMIKWVGFKKCAIEVEHAQRADGKTSYNFRTLSKLALYTILSFSDKPLRLTVKLGIMISGLSFLAALFVFYQAISDKIKVLGYSSLIISIWFLSGIIITLTGMLGLYLGRTFEQVKNRPVYIVRDTINITE